MATVSISSDTNYSALTVADGDVLNIFNSAVLTIQQTTDNISEFVCTSDGEFFIENTSTTTPIFINFGHTASTTRFRLEAGGRMKTRGALISLGVSDGTASQVFTLPTDATGEEYQLLAGLFVHMPTMDELRDGTEVPRLMARVDAFTDHFSHERLGAVFVHDTGTNQITLGDGTNGWIPPSGAEIFIPNIQFRVTNTSGGDPFIDLSSPGRMDLQYTAFGKAGTSTTQTITFGISNCGTQTWDHVVIDVDGSEEELSLQLSSGPITLTNVVFVTDRASIISQNNIGPVIKNCFMMQNFTFNNSDGFITENNTSLTVENLVYIAPNTGAITGDVGVIESNSQNVDIYNVWSASYAPVVVFRGGSSNILVQNLYPNNITKRGGSSGGDTTIIDTEGSIDLTILGIYTPMTVAEGYKAYGEALLVVNGGCQNTTLANVDYDANGQLKWIVSDSGLNTRLGNITIDGQMTSTPVRILSSSNGLEVTNLRLNAVQTVSANTDFGFGGKYNQAMINARSTGAVGTGTDNTSNHYNINEDPATGYLEMRMSPTIDEVDYFTSVVETGKIIFNQGNRMIIENLNDQVVLTSRVHGGITGFTSTGTTGGTTSDFDIEISMRRRDGTWTAYQTFDLTNASSQLSSLPADANNELQVRFRITKNTAGLNQYMQTIFLETTVDSLYEFPFVAQQVTLTLTGLQDGSEVRIYEAGNPNNEIAGQESVSGGSFVYNYDFTDSFFNGTDQDVDIVIHALGYLNIRLSGITLGALNTSIPIQQSVDRQYNNP